MTSDSEPSSYDVQTVDGQTDPYYSIDDALERAVELCSPVDGTCTVIIYLYSGDHYLLRSNRVRYRGLNYEDYSQNMKLTIKPLYCSIDSRS